MATPNYGYEKRQKEIAKKKKKEEKLKLKADLKNHQSVSDDNNIDTADSDADTPTSKVA